MKPEGHLKKAKEIEESLKKLDPKTDGALIIEGVYNTALQYIAFYCHNKHGTHMDIHSNLPRFLMTKGEDELSSLSNDLTTLRMGRWYGGKTNGESVKQAMKTLARIKEVCGIG